MNLLGDVVHLASRIASKVINFVTALIALNFRVLQQKRKIKQLKLRHFGHVGHI